MIDHCRCQCDAILIAPVASVEPLSIGGGLPDVLGAVEVHPSHISVGAAVEGTHVASEVIHDILRHVSLLIRLGVGNVRYQSLKVLMTVCGDDAVRISVELGYVRVCVGIVLPAIGVDVIERVQDMVSETVLGRDVDHSGGLAHHAIIADGDNLHGEVVGSGIDELDLELGSRVYQREPSLGSEVSTDPLMP